MYSYGIFQSSITAPTSSGYRDKFLRISLDQLQDDAFASSPPSKLFASKKRICEEEISLAECIQYNGVERNLILMEIPQSALSNVDSSIITTNKTKKKTGLFTLKLGDNSQDQEIVAYLVLRYTVVCSSSDVPQQNATTTSTSTPFIANDVTDDTEVSMTEQEASDSEDEEVFEESNPFKSPRSFSSSFSKTMIENNGSKTQPIVISENDQNYLSFSEKPLTPEKPKTNISLLTKETLFDEKSLLDSENMANSDITVVQQTTEQQKAAEQNADIEQIHDSLQHLEKEAKTQQDETVTKLSQTHDTETNKNSDPQDTTSNDDAEEGSNFFLLDEEEEKDHANTAVPTNYESTFSYASETADSLQNEIRENHEIRVDTISEIEPPRETIETDNIQNDDADCKINTLFSVNGGENQNVTEEDDFDIILSPSHPISHEESGLTEENTEKVQETIIKNISSIETENQPNVINPNVAPLNDQPHQSISTDLLIENNLNTPPQIMPGLLNDNPSSFSSLEESEKTSSQNGTQSGHDETHADNDDDEMFSPLQTSTVAHPQAYSFVESKPNENLTSKIVNSYIKEEKQVEELEELRKKNSELVEQISVQTQKILDLEKYSNSFHPMVISIIWGLICSLLYSISQKEASTINPILVCAFNTIIVYFGVQLTRSLKYYNYGTHLVNYLKEAKFFNRRESMTKKREFENYLQKLFSLEDARFLDDAFRSASWGLVLGFFTVVLKFMFLDRNDATIEVSTDFMTFFKSGILYKCVYRAVSDELFERLFCFLFSLFLFKEFNLKQRMLYVVDRVTNPNHKELYKSMNDFLEKNKIAETSKSTATASHRMGLPDYQSIILSAIISALFSINDSPSQQVFTSDSFFFDKLVGSFAFSYMFFVQERIELCMVAHFCRNFVDVLFGNY